MPNRAKTTVRLPIYEDRFFDFRRWLKARDPYAQLRYRPEGDALWTVTITVAKRYLADSALRRWAAR